MQLLTENALACMNLQLEGLHEQTEAYEHLGEVKTFSLDMKARYQKLMECQHTLISPEESDMTLACEFDAPVSLVWQFVTDPKILTETMHEGAYWSIVKRPGGRSGSGAQNHCAHGKGTMAYTYLDWRPFEVRIPPRGVEGNQKHWEMFIVEALDEGRRTRFTVRVKMIAPLPKWLRRTMLAATARKMFLEFFERTRELMRERGMGNGE